ncbi:hypothetical protein [Methylocystis sp.]|uniref:hypothetical protein n=1 Tax=Methylocystis sp. TaxID=1911079 RepID=UPI0025F46633|nr:hypothetical protein [Methylocystis sp.]
MKAARAKLASVAQSAEKMIKLKIHVTKKGPPEQKRPKSREETPKESAGNKMGAGSGGIAVTRLTSIGQLDRATRVRLCAPDSGIGQRHFVGLDPDDDFKANSKANT